MAKQRQTTMQGDDGNWRIINVAANGDEETKDSVAEVQAMGLVESLQVFQGLVSQAPNKRRAALSLGVGILLASYSKLEDYKGAGDKETGQLSNGFKEDFRKAEDAFFDTFMDDKNEAHGDFIKRLPKMNERGEPIEAENAKLAIRERYAYFIRSLRADPSYGAAKNLLLNYHAFVGQDAWHEANGETYILPPEVMRVRINAAKDVKPRDNSWETQMVTLCRALYLPDDPKKPVILNGDRIKEVQDAMALALNEVERQAKIMAAGPKKLKAGDVVEQTKDALDKANAKLPAGGPTGQGTQVADAVGA